MGFAAHNLILHVSPSHRSHITEILLKRTLNRKFSIHCLSSDNIIKILKYMYVDKRHVSSFIVIFDKGDGVTFVTRCLVGQE